MVSAESQTDIFLVQDHVRQAADNWGFLMENAYLTNLHRAKHKTNLKVPSGPLETKHTQWFTSKQPPMDHCCRKWPMSPTLTPSIQIQPSSIHCCFNTKQQVLRTLNLSIQTSQVSSLSKMKLVFFVLNTQMSKDNMNKGQRKLWHEEH